MSKSKLTNWNNYPLITAEVVTVTSEEECMSALHIHPEIIPRGMGKSYGDASLGHVVLDCTAMNKILELDTIQKKIIVEAGVTIDSILKRIVPASLFLAVVPGTKYITIGGAIAADIHGKNHHLNGTFTRHVEWIEIIDETLELVHCSPTQNIDLFIKTCGGMGLSGVIIRACIKLISIETTYIECTYKPNYSLSELLNSFEQLRESPYKVAWIDIASFDGTMLRSLLMTGEHACTDKILKNNMLSKLATHHRSFIHIPRLFPVALLNKVSITIFNKFYFLIKKSNTQLLHYDDYFFQLDKIKKWNRVFGKKGFIQYQCLLPADAIGRRAINDILIACKKKGVISYLTVLKVFGEKNPLASMSFPAPGFTLSMDLKINKELFNFLDDLDVIVENSGGKLYLAKDARMKHTFFNRSYPNKVVSNRFVSLLSKRLGLYISSKND